LKLIKEDTQREIKWEQLIIITSITWTKPNFI